jgi:PhzF family phenazine biosynthesis protein
LNIENLFVLPASPLPEERRPRGETTAHQLSHGLLRPQCYLRCMKLTLYQIDAFTSKLFGGNPAAVIPLDKWIDDDLMQRLAMENNLSETVFFVPHRAGDEEANGEAFDIRWFTPSVEINLCGHATLASAFVLYSILGYDRPKIIFHSKSGKLEIEKRGDLLVMDFPSWKPQRVDYPNNIQELVGINNVLGVYKHRDLLIELGGEADVRNVDPNFAAIKKTGDKIIVTAKGAGEVDFVSRFFAPSAGVDEDPVTGSAHSQLIPFWGEKLGKKEMRARQLSNRGGELWVTDCGERVRMGGTCVFYMKGEINLQ